jgi:hypothetical protein
MREAGMRNTRTLEAQPVFEGRPILDALPVREDESALEALPAGPSPRRPDPALEALLAALGWAWRLFAGTCLLMSYLGAVLVVGWLNRWLQARVLYAWWKQSPLRGRTSFDAFCASLGPDAPELRPRFFLRDHFRGADIREELDRPTADGEPPGVLRRAARAAAATFRSLGLNLKLGALAVAATTLLLGWGCALMAFSWQLGWLNSFHKGYEMSAVGPLTGLAGALLFLAAMFYVPMAQAHQAVTGDFKAFFEFRFVWRLVRARLTAYVAYAAFLVGCAVFFEVLKTAPAFFDGFLPAYTHASDKALLQAMQQYYLVCSFLLLLALMVSRLAAAHIYRSAVLKVLRRGRATREHLHPRLADWLDRLGLVPVAQPVREWPQRAAFAAARWFYRRLLFVLLLLLWFGFVAKVYVGEFFHYHPGVGFLNHPLIQVPCCNYTPAELVSSGQKGD